MKTIELLAPAGSPEALDAAIGEGADAVYLGLKDFNARLRSTNFTYAQFESALRSLHKMGKKVYVTVNTVFEQREADRMYQLLKYLANQGPDAVIVQDFGVIAMARAEFPSLKLHASTQMNIASARGANALSRHGVSRVVLARELSLEELRSIKAETNLELEVFVHGALCICVSGLCLFSSFLGGKSANRGMCTQACRRLYHKVNRSGGSREEENEKGYYFSPNDLQLLDKVPELFAAGIKALKIEGRMKSASYVGAVVSAYRLVADAVMNGGEDQIQQSIEQGRGILRNDFARPKTQYLFNSGLSCFAQQNNSDWLNPEQDGGTGISLGTINKIKGTGDERLALISPPRGLTISARDSVRIHRSDDSGRSSYKLTFAEKRDGGFWISAPESTQCELGDHVYLIQTKEMSKRYAQIITQVSGGKGPGREKAPIPKIELPKREEAGRKSKKVEIFPEGLYVAVSKPEDLYIVQSARPQKVMLNLSVKNAKYLLADNKPPLPFKPSEIILTLDPFFPQAIANSVCANPVSANSVSANYENEAMAEEIKLLSEKGYYQYIVNNPGHFSMFRDIDKARLIAGPWLYMFNSWALSFVASLGADANPVCAFISPLENNRQNLERTLGTDSGKKQHHANSVYAAKPPAQSRISNILHSKFFVTVFSWIPLFNIRADLSAIKIKSFADNREEEFDLITDREGSRVYPSQYFSIIDKIPFLNDAGFKRFIIDLSGQHVKKSEYKDLMRSVSENSPLPNSSRFNWKDGFFSQSDQ
ncbi:MAG: U32 family peptidase [Treponema sp.]|nr:U32 family peptidase [Treponema sp.]MCL2250426.1 U32 family peptidase [Treponema sp.]